MLSNSVLGGILRSNFLESTFDEAPESIWNLNATVNWSLLFTHVFGAWLQMLNWQSLCESELANISRRWFYASLVMVAVYPLLVLLYPDIETTRMVTGFIHLSYLLTWYFGAACPQARYVKEGFGDDFNRRLWKKSLWSAFGLLTLYQCMQLAAAQVVAGYRAG